MRKINMRNLYYFICLFLISSCGDDYVAPDLKKMTENFNLNYEKHELLAEMVKKDYQGKYCFTVGLDNIGDFWKDPNDNWTESSDYKNLLNIYQVLKKVSISSDRYNQYKSLFAATSTERTTYCKDNNTESFSQLTYRTGLGVSGCSIEFRKKTPIPKAGIIKSSGKYIEIIHLINGWYLEYNCT